MKCLLIVLLCFLTGCAVTTNNGFNDCDDLKNDINESIIDGFYNCDTIGISNTIYLLK